MTTAEKLFDEEKIKNMRKIFDEETKNFRENPEEELAFLHDKGLFDTLSLANPSQFAENISIKGTHKNATVDYNKKDDALYFQLFPGKVNQSIELDKNIFIDFDENYFPVSLRILKSTKVFNLKPYNIKNIKSFKMKIKVDSKIRLNLKFGFPIHQNDETFRELNPITDNYLNIPDLENNFTLATG